MMTTIADPKFMQIEERKIVGLSRDYTMDNMSNITLQWNEFWQSNQDIENAAEGVVYGVSYGQDTTGKFSYQVGLEARPPKNVQPPYCVVTLSAGEYAVFSHRGPSTSIPQVFGHAFRTWMPASQYQQREGAVFERYTGVPDAEGNMDFEVWVPVQPKE